MVNKTPETARNVLTGGYIVTLRFYRARTQWECNPMRLHLSRNAAKTGTGDWFTPAAP